jgi:hypothetical protein
VQDDDRPGACAAVEAIALKGRRFADRKTAHKKESTLLGRKMPQMFPGFLSIEPKKEGKPANPYQLRKVWGSYTIARYWKQYQADTGRKMTAESFLREMLGHSERDELTVKSYMGYSEDDWGTNVLNLS